jgi:heme-degrading monooxygenase HmoA
MLVILFRSKLTPEAGEDYNATSDEMHSLVRENPGFVDVKHYKSDDGERLTMVWFKDKESLRAWRELPQHREAQRTGRQKWYEYYKMEVATIERVTGFERKERLENEEGFARKEESRPGDDSNDQARGARPWGIDSPA